METNPKFNQKAQEKTTKNHKKHSKIDKKHPQKGIWPLPGLQVGQNGSKRGREQNFGGPLGLPGGPQNSQKVKKMRSENRSKIRMI